MYAEATTTVQNSAVHIEQARIRTAFVELINAPLLETIDEDLVGRLMSPEFLSVLEDYLSSENDQCGMRAGLSHILAYLRNAEGKDRAVIATELNVDRTRLYKGVSADFGPPPPLETVWVSKGLQDNHILRELTAEYMSIGKVLSSEAMERLDYLGVQLGYYRTLIQLELTCLEEGQDVQLVEQLKAKQGAFLEHHLCNWVFAYLDAAAPFADSEFFVGHLAAIRGFLDMERVSLRENTL